MSINFKKCSCIRIGRKSVGIYHHQPMLGQ